MKGRWFTLVALLLGACSGKVECSDCKASFDGGSGSEDAGVADMGRPDVGPRGDAGTSEANLDVYERLLPTCGSCHAEGSSRPFFANLESFENLIVYDETWIVAGDPDSSPLLPLLQGQGSGTYTQMPVGGSPFSVRDEQGQTSISMDELRQWITDLPPRTEGPRDGREQAVLVRLKTAEQIQQALYDQLGLSDETFFTKGETYIGYIRGGQYTIISPAATPQPHANAGASGRSALQRFLALGGPDHLAQRGRRREVSPLLLHTLVQVSQAWCRRSLSEDPSHILGDLELGEVPDPAALRSGFERLYLKMLGDPATDEDVDRMYRLFMTYEPESVTTAWVAVCSALVRDPLWLTY